MAKLKPVTHGPVTLSKIDYSAALSQETAAFVAEISVVVEGGNGQVLKSSVRNEGHGGSSFISCPATWEEIEAYAESLPDMDTPYGPLKMCGDTLIGMMLDQAIEAQDDARYKKKGYTHKITAKHPTKDEIVFYSNKEPDSAMYAKQGITDAASVKVQVL